MSKKIMIDKWPSIYTYSLDFVLKEEEISRPMAVSLAVWISIRANGNIGFISGEREELGRIQNKYPFAIRIKAAGQGGGIYRAD